jgi:hypothetical protein
MASTSHCADDAIFPSPFTSTIPARPGVYLDKEAKKKNQGRRSLSLNLVSKPTNLNQRAKQECRINQASKQKLFRVSKSKNHHRKASKQASKQERSKNMQNTSKGKPPPTPSLTNPNTRKEPIHPSTYIKNTFRKKIFPNQLSLSQLNRILLLPDPDPNPHSTPSLYKTGVERTCLMPGGTGNGALRVATTPLAERVFADNLVADNFDDVVVVAVRGSGSGGRGRRMWRATESIVKPRDAIT